MARKKEGNIFVQIFIMLLALLIFAIIVTIVISPIIFIGVCLYYKAKIKKYMPIPQNTSDFWLNENEKQNFIEKHQTLTQAFQNIQIATNHGIEQGISKNKDGSFSRRSRIGKQVAMVIDKSNEIIENNQEEYRMLTNLPQQKWKEFKKFSVRMNAAKSAVKIYIPTGIICFLVYYFYYRDYWLELSACCGLISVLAYFLFLAIHDKNFKTNIPEPPIVDINNLNEIF